MSKIETKLLWIHRHITLDIFYKTFVYLLNKLALSMHMSCYLSKNNDKFLTVSYSPVSAEVLGPCLLTKSRPFLPEVEWYRG